MTNTHPDAPQPPLTAANRIVAGEFDGTWADLEPLELPECAAVFVRDDLEALRAVWHQQQHQRELLVAAASRREPGLEQDLLDLGLNIVADGAVVAEPAEQRRPRRGRVWLLTSGSTGRPKQVGHTLDTLLTVRGKQPTRTWLNPYTPGAYAWWQVTTLALAHPGTSMVCVDGGHPWAEQAAKYGVDAASGTPTFWRQALLTQRDELRGVDFKQITLGGEPVDQAVIDLLKDAFPNARVSWIYASSEAGASIAVHDGKAGFPEAWLSNHKEGRPALSVDGDELLIASPHRGDGVAETLRTGDRVEIRDGRVHITGRLGSDEINVGGTKVSAGKVRGVLLEHPGIAWAAIKARKAPIVGHMVQASVVLDDPSLTQDDIIRYCTERLAETEVPRRVRILDEIPLKESLKSDV